MDFSIILTIIAVAIGFFVIFRKFRFHQENQEINPSSSSVSPPSSLSTSSPSISSSHNWIHDVFPSFRGEDVRIDFLSHIQKEFRRKGITPFFDNEIKRGESIGLELIRAIRGSKIAVIFLSRNYASSKWCLDELVEIMKCREELGQTVMVIFYKVDPSDVKKLAGDFGKVFKKTCAGKSKEDIQRWREALVKVATIAGYHLSKWDNEAAMIETIAIDVSNELNNSVQSSDFDGYVGMRTHMEKMKPFLDLGSNEVKMIGIWGPSGIGKSAIARALFRKHSHQFQLSVFMENIKRRYPRPCSDEYSVKLQLQKEFLSQILHHKDTEIHHLGVARDRLKHKRVLVVLDDVDQSLQLEAMAKEAGWFGRGSRIIITTQDKKLLNAPRINHIYEVDFPRYHEAIGIFCMRLYDGFENLAWEVIGLAGKLPLGLRVMGSYLNGKTKLMCYIIYEKWKRELPRLQASLDVEISRDSDGLVGMRAHMENMNRLLSLDSNEVKMIGIWGPFGSGKSTIARALFSKHSHEFQLSVFMENIRRSYPSIQGYNEYSVKRQLQKEFLSQILHRSDIEIQHLGVEQGKLKDKRVFVVLDDVDHSMQLETMAKETGWFGRGSRIIITTQDKKILDAHGINHIYKVDFPDDNEALEIFCTFAFGQNSPGDGFESLSRKVTQLAGKLPLTLRVMGSYLKGMAKEKWEGELPRLHASLDGEIESILELSYNSLHAEDKELFLYIACFFNNERTEKVEEHLAKNFSNVTQGLHVLAEKSHICVTSSGDIKMHDFLERFGREIVRKRSILDPQQPQFLVDAGDICKVLNTTDKVSHGSVIGAIINLSQIVINRSDIALERFSSLEFLRLYDDSYNSQEVRLVDNLHHHSRPTSKILNCLPRKVRLLDWRYLRMIHLPIHFNPELLVELKMQNSELEKLWRGIKPIKNLKWMDLSYSRQLRKLPDLSTATNLCELNLCCCSSLVELPSSIGKADHLQKLDLSHCSSLLKLPSSIWNTTKLQRLDLSHCSKLEELPSFVGNVISLQRLNLSRCSSLKELPYSIENATNLQELYLSGCSSLEELPSSIGNVTSLGELDLSGCSSLVELPSSIGNITTLWSLDLSHCSSLVKLPSSIGNLKLSRLRLQGCAKLEAIPININMESLDELDLTDCWLLKKYPHISTNIPETTKEEIPVRSRLELRISHWENLGVLSHAFKYIGKLHLRDKRIHEISPWIKELSRLQKLVIKGCTKLVSLPQLPDSLRYIDAENCESLERLHCSFHNREFDGLHFANCFKLSQEARDLIIKTSTSRFALLPGEKVPPHFTYRATGSFLSVKLNGVDTNFATSLRLKACVMLVDKGDIEVGDWTKVEIIHRMKEKQNGVNVTRRSIRYQSQLLKKHLCIFHVEERVRSSELVFEFEINDEKWEIGECGILYPQP